jgi:hypothetical protein
MLNLQPTGLVVALVVATLGSQANKRVAGTGVGTGVATGVGVATALLVITAPLVDVALLPVAPTTTHDEAKMPRERQRDSDPEGK